VLLTKEADKTLSHSPFNLCMYFQGSQPTVCTQVLWTLNFSMICSTLFWNPYIVLLHVLLWR